MAAVAVGDGINVAGGMVLVAVGEITAPADWLTLVRSGASSVLVGNGVNPVVAVGPIVGGKVGSDVLVGSRVRVEVAVLVAGNRVGGTNV